MPKQGIVVFFWLFWGAVFVFAQDDDLITQNVRVENQLDAFGVEVQVLIGELYNSGDAALTGINIYADLLDEDGEVIGEGFGFMVDSCGTALLDEALQPGHSRGFLANVDLFAEGEITDFELFIEEQPAPELMIEDAPMHEAITKASGGEVVAVEWIDETTLRYGIGCPSRVFTTYDWYQYDLNSGDATPLEAHPAAELITEPFMQVTGINQLTQSKEIDETLFDRSYLSFPVQSTRAIFQSDIRTVITVEHDGSFRRVIHELLHSYSLQGFNWTQAGNFLAYYYGAYGDPVRYFTASGRGGLISAVLTANTPSEIVPGVYNDGQRVVIGGTFEHEGEETTGYWLSSTVSQSRELLFEVDQLPGNNYPAPAYYRKDGSTRYFYILRPINDYTVLQCYFREGNELYTLASLPIQIEEHERAWSYLSPEFNSIAIAATGMDGGLWIIDLNDFEVCR